MDIHFKKRSVSQCGCDTIYTSYFIRIQINLTIVWENDVNKFSIYMFSTFNECMYSYN